MLKEVRQKFKLNSAVKNIYQIMKVQAEFKKIKLILVNRLKGDKLVVKNDQNRLNQVSINLISNAIKFVEKNTGEIYFIV